MCGQSFRIKMHCARKISRPRARSRQLNLKAGFIFDIERVQNKKMRRRGLIFLHISDIIYIRVRARILAYLRLTEVF